MLQLMALPYVTLRAVVGPALCLLLYIFGCVHGPFPLLASLLFSVLLVGAIVAQGWWAMFYFVLAGIAFLALGFGVVPGFTRIDLGVASIGSGKALAGISAMMFFPSPWRWNRRCSIITAICVVTAPLLAWGIGYASWAPAPFAVVAIFAFANLFGTLAEEWFFRRWLQAPLQRYGAALSLGIVALLFGLAHFGGGLTFMALATIGGLAYAGVYHVSGNSIWAAIGLHWGLNIIRVALFDV
jgi:uncharacterized protein